MRLSVLNSGLFIILTFSLSACNRALDYEIAMKDSTSLNGGLYLEDSATRATESDPNFIIYSISDGKTIATVSRQSNENANIGFKNTLQFGENFEVFKANQNNGSEMRQISRCFYKSSSSSKFFYNLIIGEKCPQLKNYLKPGNHGSAWIYSSFPSENLTTGKNFKPLYVFELEKSNNSPNVNTPLFMLGLADLDKITDGTLIYKRYKNTDSQKTPFKLGYVNQVTTPLAKRKGFDELPAYLKTPRNPIDTLEKCGVFYPTLPGQIRVPADCQTHISVSPVIITKRNQSVEIRYHVPVSTNDMGKVSCNIIGVEENLDKSDVQEHLRQFANIPIDSTGHGRMFDIPNQTTNYRFICTTNWHDHSIRVDFEKNIKVLVLPDVARPTPVVGSGFDAGGGKRAWMPDIYDTRNCGILANQARITPPPTDKNRVNLLCKKAFWMGNFAGVDDENICQYRPTDDRKVGELFLAKVPTKSADGLMWEWSCVQTTTNGCFSDNMLHRLEDIATKCRAPVYTNDSFIPNDPRYVKLIAPW
jgi:hypothetical protein